MWTEVVSRKGYRVKLVGSNVSMREYKVSRFPVKYRVVIRLNRRVAYVTKSILGFKVSLKSVYVIDCDILGALYNDQYELYTGST